MAPMIPDEKKEEIRDTADLVEVAEDYVKLKRSGRSWKGLCPFHDEKTPSFHVTPELGIYKCFGCGESGDVFNFVMEMEGIGFIEAMRTLADRFGISLPEMDDPEENKEHHLREGIYHALKYAGVFYHSRLTETDEAEKARQYLQKRGYNRPISRKYGLGYAPNDGNALYRAATDSGLNEEYLLEAGLIKPSNRGEGFYDAFRGRLMFPIFNPSGKVIAFAGRVLGDQKTAKYINSPQTKVYNKSEVLYGVNFAKNDIRKRNEVLLVEGYTDVISLQQHEVQNVVASSGTSLTPAQLKLLQRYGDTITMIYDSDAAGQKAMKRGINLALTEGMDVKLLELPEGDDPDSFIRQFGKDSFLEMKKEGAENFVNYLIHKAQKEGEWDADGAKDRVISEILDSIAHIPNKIKREVKVQALNKLSEVGDRALFEELGKKLQDIEQERQRAKRRKKRQAKREAQRNIEPPESHTQSFTEQQASSRPKRQPAPPQKRPSYEKELIRLMLVYDSDMIAYIGSHCSERHFEDEQISTFYADIIERHKAKKEVSVKHYAAKDHPYPKLVGEITFDEHAVSERRNEKVEQPNRRDKNPYKTAKGALKSLQYNYLVRMLNDLTDDLKTSDEEHRKETHKKKMEIQRRKTRLERYNADDLFPDPDSDEAAKVSDKIFRYKMKGEK